MGRIATGLGILAVAVACSGRGCRPGPIAKRFIHSTPARSSTKSAKVSALETELKQPLRVFHTQAIGDIRDHRWSDDERWLVVWSDSTVVAFDMQTQRVVFRYSMPFDRRVSGAGLSPDGRWIIMASNLFDVKVSTLELFAIGESTPKRSLTSAATCDEQCWQFDRNSQTLAWVGTTTTASKPTQRLHVDDIMGNRSRLEVDLPDVEDANIYGLELSASGRILVVQREGQVSIVDLATARARHYPAAGNLAFAMNGEALAWADKDSFVLWSPDRDDARPLSNPRCSPRNWPPRYSADIRFSDDAHTLATSGDTGVCLWDVATGRLRTVLQSWHQPQSDFRPSPGRWVHSDKGLIVGTSGGNELWDVEHRRPVKVGFTEWSRSGSLPLLLDVPDEYTKPMRLFSFDAQFKVRQIALQHDKCAYDRTGEHSPLIGFEHTAVMTCLPNPWIVDLTTGESRRVTMPSAWLASSPRGSRVAMTSQRSLVVADPDKPGSEHPLIGEVVSTALSGFDGQKLWMPESPEWQEFRWASLDISNGMPHVETGAVVPRCGKGNMYLVGAHFVWTQSDESPIELCDVATGRELANTAKVMHERIIAVNDDASIAVLGGPTGHDQLWFIKEMKTVDLDTHLYHPVFAGPRTLVGKSDDKVITLDLVTLDKSSGWDSSIIDDGSIAAANVASDLVVIEGRKPALRRLSDGKVIARLPVRQVSTAAFGPKPLLFASNGQRIWVWRLPSPKPVGELLLEPDGVLFVAADGKFESNRPRARWQESLACSVGQQQLPLQTCIDNLYEPGLIKRALAPN